MNEHFYIPKNHRISIIIFLSLMMLCHLISFYFSKNDDDILIREYSLTTQIDKQQSKLKDPRLTSFDPNTADREMLIRQGLSEYAAKSLINYRATGWKAKSPEDLLKVYGIDSSSYEKFKERIKIENVSGKVDNRIRKKKVAKTISTDLFDPNTASYHELRDQGFSNYAAKSLRRYLETGARIETKEDLKEIYGVDEALYLAIEDRVVIRKLTSVSEVGDVDSSRAKLEVTALFDPNTASLEELLNQGLDRKTANFLLNYRKKVFIREKEQLKKIYGMTDSLYASIESRVQIDSTSLITENFPNEYPNKDSSNAKSASPDTAVYNLNTITQEELLEMKGIGPYYSKAIIAYRDKLGGFYNVNQLLEVPAFKEENFNILKDRFEVDGNISRISPVAEFKELLRHPYIDYELAKKFKSMSVFDMEDRIQEMISTGQIEEKLVPYLQKY